MRVLRQGYSINDKKLIALNDVVNQKLHADAEFQLLFWGDEYIYSRNCHDYAWGPYMSCCPDGEFVLQKEAWWMNDPSANWLDGSMVIAVTSITTPPEAVADFLFNTSDLEGLPFLYYDIFGEMVPLPACPLNTLNEVPSHAAILIDWFTPPGLPGDLSAGIFVSKWGDFGIYRHRWGSGYCPDIYCNKDFLRIFAPRPQWQPAYYIVHTPWG